MKESPIFIKSFETLLWLLEHTSKFPRHQRFVMAKRMEEAGLSFHDCIVWATKTRDKRKVLGQADYHLERLKIYNRLSVNRFAIKDGGAEALVGSRAGAVAPGPAYP